ncbi:MAG: M1 family metallopeptidase [Actinomycetes bacterium]
MRLGGAVLGIVALTGVTAAPALASTHGARTAGDPYFPLQGNGGYDVRHYGLRLKYDTVSRHLTARTTITAVAAKRLTRFDLDFRRNLRISTVTVNGVGAVFTQPAALTQELVVRPHHALPENRTFTVVVRYAGVPRAVTDPDGSIEGWVATKDGAFVVGEPQGSPAWFPCNDTPRDKATYDFRVTVPKGITAVANGELTRTTTKGRWSTFRWHTGEPMSTYLATVTTGKFQVRTGTTPGGVPYYIAVDPTLAAKSKAVLGKLPAITDYLAELYGPYPFSSTGAVVDNAPKVGYALETQTKPVYDRAPDELTLAHEAAHMYFGDSVTLKRWRDIWIAEGFAEFSSWMWSEHSGSKTAQQLFDSNYKRGPKNSIWKPPPGNPGSAADLFSDSVYTRGAMTLQALRVKLGDPTFFGLLRAWHDKQRDHNVTVGQFTAFASRYSGRSLTLFFDTWLYAQGKPKAW